jgi:voltage-gated potassium channel
MMIKRLMLAFILLAVVFISGVCGYMLIEGWSFLDSLYMTVITIASVGYMEVNPLSHQGRIFTIFLIIFGMGVLLFGISTFTAFLVEGELSEMLGRRKMEKKISGLKEHYIVCGIGGIGRHIMDELYKTGRHFIAIDKDEDVCKELNEKGILFIRGDATSTSILMTANADYAKGIFCSLSNDAENLLLILTAKGINPGLKIVAKAEEDESKNKMRKAGADGVILPEFIGGLRMASEMIRPEAVTFLDKMLKSGEEVFRVEDISLAADSVFIGKTLGVSGLLDKEGSTVVAVRKGDKYIFNPSKDERLETGDALILIGETKSVREVKKLAG